VEPGEEFKDWAEPRKELNLARKVYLVHPSVLVLDDVRVAEACHQGHLQQEARTGIRVTCFFERRMNYIGREFEKDREFFFGSFSRIKN
jgi:hypothetical protein